MRYRALFSYANGFQLEVASIARFFYLWTHFRAQIGKLSVLNAFDAHVNRILVVLLITSDDFQPDIGIDIDTDRIFFLDTFDL